MFDLVASSTVHSINDLTNTALIYDICCNVLLSTETHFRACWVAPDTISCVSYLRKYMERMVMDRRRSTA